MTRMELTAQAGGWVLPVAAQKVTRLCIDNQAVRVLCHNMVEIYAQEPFTLITPDGLRHLMNPGGDATELAPLLRIMRRVILAGTAYEDGRLELAFDDGSVVYVPSGDAFEAWTLSGPGGPDGMKIVSMPGGELAIWQDRRLA